MAKFIFNHDVKKRDMLLFGKKYEPAEYLGGIKPFYGITAEKLKQLVEQHFADPYERQNDSPSIDEFLEYADRQPDVTFDGYAVCLERNDYRVSIETVHQTFRNKDNALEFTKAFRRADEFDVNDHEGRAWWD